MAQGDDVCRVGFAWVGRCVEFDSIWCSRGRVEYAWWCLRGTWTPCDDRGTVYGSLVTLCCTV